MQELRELREHAKLRGLGEAASVLWDEYVEAACDRFGAESHHAATACNDRAIFHETSGRYAEALSGYGMAVDTWKALGDQCGAFVAMGLINSGDTLRQIGDLDRALGCLEEALRTIKNRHVFFESPEQKMTEHARCLHSIGHIHMAAGRHADAQRLLSESLTIARCVPSESAMEIASVLMSLTMAEIACGSYEAAEQHVREAIKIKRRAFGRTSPLAERSRSIVGRLHMARGEWGDAVVELRASCRASAIIGEERYLDAMRVYDELGDACAADGRVAEALSLKHEVAERWTATLADVMRGASEDRRLRVVQESFRSLDRLLSLVVTYAPSDPHAIRIAFDAVLRRKGIVLEVMRQEQETVLSGRYPDAAPRWSKLQSVRAELARLCLGTVERSEPVRRRIEELDAVKQRLEAELSDQIPDFELDARFRAFDHTALLTALPKDTVLVEFVRFNMFDFSAALDSGQAKHGPRRYLAFVVMPQPQQQVAAPPVPAKWWRRLMSAHKHERTDTGGLIHIIDLGDADAIDRKIDTYLACIQNCTDDKDEAGPFLTNAIYNKLSDALQASQRWLLAPDGDLNRLPFEVLPIQKGTPERQDTRLIDLAQISYLTTGRDLLRIDASNGSGPTEPLVIANPDFDLSAAARGNTCGYRYPFEPLPDSELEGREVAARLGVEPCLGAEAMEGRVKARRAPRVLHFATHGFFLKDQAAAIASGFGRVSAALLENPLRRSGLALAGINTWLAGRQVPVDAEDGLLTAEDVLNLDLRGTDLVVLSACVSGCGEISVGEGVFGLRRSFVLAGARALVMSAWHVPDSQTERLMAHFYTNLVSGLDCTAALRSAQQAMRGKNTPTLDWGAFICFSIPRTYIAV